MATGMTLDQQAAGLPRVPGVVWMPGEQVLLLSVRLPAISMGQRRAAAGFAVEDRIAEPLEDVTVVLGPDLKGAHLVAVVNRAVLAGSVAGVGPATKVRLVPDVLALPQPGAGWSVLALGDRVLVRQADGTGFATTAQAAVLFWTVAGAPEVVLYGGVLPPAIAVTGRADLPAPDPAVMRFDLAAGGKDGRGPRLPVGVRALALVLFAGAALHLAVLAADVLALGKMARAREAALRDALVAAGQTVGADVEAAFARALAVAAPEVPGGFLPLLAEVSAVLAGSGVQMQSLGWSETGSMTMTIEASDLATLQSAQSALGDNGFRVESGAATTGEGGAEMQITLTGGQS